MTNWNYIVIGVCSLLAAFLVWKELSRQNKSRLVWRIVASVLAVTSLAFMAIPVWFNSSTHTTQKNEAVLLTEGYNKDSLNKFLRSHAGIAVYAPGEYKEQEHDGFSSLHVFGYGLTTDEWKELQPPKIFFHPSAPGNGITAIDWTRKIETGKSVMVQGKFNNTANNPIKLVLSSFGISLDSVMIAAGREQQFELKTIPKFIGKAIFDLTATIEKDTLKHEHIPVEVLQTEPLKILLLAAYPDFENKFLNNWLSDNNYTIAMRTTISKNKYSMSLPDSGHFSLTQITSAVLEQFDVVIADAAELSNLSRQELFNIKTQVTENGLGLIIKADSSKTPTLTDKDIYKIIPAANRNKQMLALNIWGNDTMALLPVEQPLFIQPNQSLQALITDDKKNMLACNTIAGMGKVILTTLNNTYTWMLSGDNKSYQALWSLLIEKAARKKVVSEEWNINPVLPVINQPMQVYLSTINNPPPAAHAGESFVSLTQQPYLPFQWQGSYWPGKEGWQAVSTNNGEPFYFYVFNKDAWKNIAALQKIHDTYNYASTNAGISNNAHDKNESNKTPVPPFYFFIVFICCCSFLWIEKKLS